jgi:hypothetical protein
MLHRQLELHELEQELKQLDAKDDATEERRYRLQSVEYWEGLDTAQKDLLEKISTKLREYGKTNQCKVDFLLASCNPCSNV